MSFFFVKTLISAITSYLYLRVRRAKDVALPQTSFVSNRHHTATAVLPHRQLVGALRPGGATTDRICERHPDHRAKARAGPRGVGKERIGETEACMRRLSSLVKVWPGVPMAPMVLISGEDN